jgi:hypothetical protein
MWWGFAPRAPVPEPCNELETRRRARLYGISAHGFKNLTVSIFKHRKNWSMKKLTETVLAAVARFYFH